MRIKKRTATLKIIQRNWPPPIRSFLCFFEIKSLSSESTEEEEEIHEASESETSDDDEQYVFMMGKPSKISIPISKRNGIGEDYNLRKMKSKN